MDKQPRLTASIPDQPGWAGTRIANHSGYEYSKAWCSWQLCRLELQSSSQIHPEYLYPIFTGWIPFHHLPGWISFLPPNQRCQSTEGKILG